MSYKIEKIKEGIKLHYIKTDKFKTNIISIFLTTPLQRKTVTSNALIPLVLRRGTKLLTSQDEISKKLEEMYGATFDCGVEKTGDNQIIKFYLEMVNDIFLPNNSEELKNGIDLLLDIILNPLLENNGFKEEYVNSEKENLKKIIKSRIDNKDKYAYERCIEEMYKNKTYGINKTGYIEDLEKIDNLNLYEAYLKLISESKIDIFISGDIDDYEELLDYINCNRCIAKLEQREGKYIINSIEENIPQNNPKIIEEKLDVTQGKLVIGADVKICDEDSKYKISLYNAILGEGATSKLFQNVREKESLAYTASSNYIRQKGNIFIRCGIEIKNYEKALNVINKQLQDMKNGQYTEEDIQNAKKYIISGLKSVKEEQDSEISYFFGQELLGKFTSVEEYEEKIKNIMREDIQKVANGISINTIYFLKNRKEQ